MLPPDRLNRFARHIVLPEIGGAGQVALANARVTLVGLGGIGSPALQYLAAAGIGHLRLIDDDVVDISNLQRQTIYAEADVGKPKHIAAQQWVARFDAALEVETVAQRITADNAADCLAGSDVVLDGTDNFATRLAVSDAATALKIPLVSAAIGRFQGQIASFKGWLADEPCYRCFVGDAFDAEDCDTCADDGVLGAMCGIVGSMAAMEAIRLITPFGAGDTGKLHLIDGLKPGMRTLTIAKDEACRGCSASQ